MDLEHGKITCDENKTNDIRGWALDPSVVAALKKWRARHPLREDGGKNPKLDARVDDQGHTISNHRLPDALRSDLPAASVDRPELHELSKNRLNISATTCGGSS